MKILLLSPIPENKNEIAAGISGWTKRFIESDTIKNEHQTYVVNTGLIGKRATGNGKKSICEEFVRIVNIIKRLKIGISEFQPDIVHLNTNCSNLGLLRDYIEALIVTSRKIPLIVHFRCDVSHYSYTKISYFAMKRMCKKATGLFVLTNSSRHYINEHFELDSIRIPLFISPYFLIQNNRIIRDQIESIVFVGHVTKSKGVDIIIEVASVLPHIAFHIIGPIIGDNQPFTDLPDNVIMHGNCTKEFVLGALSASDLFLFPSETEGFPNAVLEAMACGLPIIASPVGAIPDMVGPNQEGGILVRTREMQDYVDVINELSNDSQKRYQMSKRNYEEVVRFYSESIVINRMLEEYGECIARKR